MVNREVTFEKRKNSTTGVKWEIGPIGPIGPIVDRCWQKFAGRASI